MEGFFCPEVNTSGLFFLGLQTPSGALRQGPPRQKGMTLIKREDFWLLFSNVG
jgi:hypothetical protein